MKTTLNNTIKLCRNKNNLTQQELADKVYVARETIINIENNKSLPRIDVALKIAHALNQTVEDTFFQINNESETNNNNLVITQQEIFSDKTTEEHFGTFMKSYLGTDLPDDAINAMYEGVKFSLEIAKTLFKK